MAVLFISDLHLCPSRLEVNAQFFAFLAGPARGAEALYILGDLFEYWAGDDDMDDPFNASVLDAMRACNRHTPVRLMHGNRDFLIGERFSTRTGVRLISDPFAVDVCGVPTLLTHGDALCTDDSDYQRFRSEVRSPRWMETFLAQPLPARKTQIEALRRKSELEKRNKRPEIMDVNRGAVDALFRAYGYRRLIHGHTHKPGRHEHLVDGHRCERWVLADWYELGSCLRADSSGLTAGALDRP
jgi:UDP-2,3-diacylglucosamine hydrolase